MEQTSPHIPGGRPQRPRTRPGQDGDRRSGRWAALAATAVILFAVPAPSAPIGATAAPFTPSAAVRAPVPPGAAPPDGRPSCTLPPDPQVQLSEGLPTGTDFSRSTGTVHALTLMVDFPDEPGQGTARQRFGEFFPRTTRWFTRASYGRLDYRPATPVRRWLRMPHTFRSYGIRRGSPFEPGYRKLVRDIAATADPLVDFRRYDLVNVLLTPNAGPPAAQTVLSVTFAGNPEAPIADGVPLSNISFIYSRQDDGSGSYAANGYRVLPHENGHDFGLPDLYTAAGGERAGHWDVMSEDWGSGNDLLAWHKWKLGWLSADQVRCLADPGTASRSISPLHRKGGTKLVFVPVSAATGYTVEVRANGGNDEGICKPGVLISWVDSRVDSGKGPITVMDSTPRSGGCTSTPNVQPELSDAPFAPGESLDDSEHGVRIAVTGKDRKGEYRVEVTRRASGGGR
ncbi:M6 family metalloprotease domain-containing protein [Streptomyces palmae]|uniref:M6 family metalloprotease domain-containing protein n=1 Tax=Streptomyces palmae TaxID=1701085 RepID=A0A4Z0GNP9_9ACTN|nr:M6 family metalloprotease domain-containing protein [Streptomyces palmae]TGA97903.1 M6 family metalloprotease domain-containing protein [Streptomyces palmae]